MATGTQSFVNLVEPNRCEARTKKGLQCSCQKLEDLDFCGHHYVPWPQFRCVAKNKNGRRCKREYKTYYDGCCSDECVCLCERHFETFIISCNKNPQLKGLDYSAPIEMNTEHFGQMKSIFDNITHESYVDSETEHNELFQYVLEEINHPEFVPSRDGKVKDETINEKDEQIDETINEFLSHIR